MPQIFQVLKCYKCSVFQIHQTKKSNKFDCKMCGEKQSIKRHYGIGSGKDCRMHVQKLNLLRGDMEANCNIQSNSDEAYGDSNIHEAALENITSLVAKPIKRSKWSEFVDVVKETEVTEDPMFLGDVEVVLEIPVKRKTNNMKFKTKSNYHRTHSNDSCKTNIGIKSKDTVNRYSDLESKNTPQDNILYNNEISSREQLANNITKEVIEDLETQTVHQTFDRNSKWAQFIDANENSDMNIDVMAKNNQDECEESDILLKQDLDKSFSKSGNLFSQCDDIELYDILDI